MKAVILAGGLGTRLSEETGSRPKPMVEIGGRPILWHIMKMYLRHGIRDFVICCGYKGYVIKEFFANYRLHVSDVTIDSREQEIFLSNNYGEDWRVTLVDTGETTMTGGRLARVKEHVAGDDAFCLTYGDGVSSVDISALVKYHQEHGAAATVTAVHPPSRFGVLEMEGDRVQRFAEKPLSQADWINGGFFVLSPKIFDYLGDDTTVWEAGPLEALAAAGELRAFFHDGFWQPMDTLRDKQVLEEMWADKKAPWKCW